MTIIPEQRNITKEKTDKRFFDQIAMSILFRKLDAIQTGFLQIYCDAKVYEFGPKCMRKSLCAKIYIHDIRTFKSILLGGEPAAGYTYVQGWWSTEDLIQVIRLFTINRSVLFSFKYGLGSLAKFLSFFTKIAKRNSKKGSKSNICAHYDIGNDLYRLFLDSKMMYSSAMFTSNHTDLERASEYKLKLICEKLKLSPGDKVLEIGCGWGGFAVYAAENYGCHVTSTTISDEQYNYSRKLIAQKNLQNSISLIKEDYRNLQGQYDKLVSIEMIESVGHEYLDTYFSQCSKLLKPKGIMLIQAITISDHLYQQYISSMDFIRKYVFPGGSLPSVARMLASTANHTDLTLFHDESYASSYAKTLAIWYQRFIENKSKVIELGYSQSFIRLWEYYLKYCQAGFEERVIDVHHLVFKKPNNRFDSIYQ